VQLELKWKQKGHEGQKSHRLRGEGRGEALRQAQLEMLRSPKLRHPHYWASFIQAGEWANLDGKR